MPKKQPRNAFYFFMLDHKEEQKKLGIHYENMGEIQVAADPKWREAHPSVRAKYEAMAKREKDKIRGAPDRKYTSQGVSFAQIEYQQQLAQQREDSEIAVIKNFVQQKNVLNKLLEADIFIIDINYYCSISSAYFVGESTVLRFSLSEGIKDIYHEIINPGQIPVGYAFDVKMGAAELGLDMPNEDAPRTDYRKVLAYLMDFLKRNSKESHVPPLYTLPEKVEPCTDFIRQLCISSNEDETQLQVYKLESLFYHIVNAIKDPSEEGYPKLTLATAQLKKDPFKYTPGLGCEHHEEGEKSMECTRSRVQRWAYTVLDKCCPLAGIDVALGRHVPPGVDIEGVLTFKEQRKEMMGPKAPTTAISSCNTSVVNDSFETSGNSVWDRPKNTKRVHQPLRMPKTDYSQSIRPAPELTEENFPSLISGYGRGRGIARSLNKMTLDK